MRDDLLVILNQREPLKREKAAELLVRAEERSIAADSFDPGPDVVAIIKERYPRVLVLDYILGDFGTALEVLQTLASLEGIEPIPTIVWTDEPSVLVAVSTLKHGARDYIEMGSGQDVEKVLDAVEGLIEEQESATSTSSGRSLTLSQDERLIYQAPSCRHCPAVATSLAKRGVPVVVILGETGTGRSALARHIHTQRTQAGELIELNVDTWPGEIDELFGASHLPRVIPLLSHGATVVLDHAEFDSGELLEAAVERKSLVWNTAEHIDDPMLVVGTNSREVAQAWSRLLECDIIEIPPLHERAEDILPLLQHLISSLGTLAVNSSLKISPDVIRLLSGLNWPGNIRQFRSAILETVTTPLAILEDIHAESFAPNIDGAESLDDETTLLLRSVLAAKERWEKYHAVPLAEPNPSAARHAVEMANGSLRIAAVSLGTGVQQIRAGLNE